MSLFTRDDARYWRSQPADHNEAGFFVVGPQEAAPVTARLAQTPLCPWTPETPTVAHARMSADRARRKMLIGRQLAFVRSLNLSALR
jgi:hypothetical protein